MGAMSGTREFEVSCLLSTDTVTVRDIHCRGTCRHRSSEECTGATHLVFPYRGLYMRHVGREQAVADANHVLFFNAREGYSVSHPVAGSDNSLDLAVSESVLSELAPPAMLHESGGRLTFALQHLRIDARAQVLVALLRHTLMNGTIEAFEAESLSLTLVSRSLGARTSHAPRATYGQQRLVDRVKLLLSSQLSRRWTLAAIAKEIGGSPVYLTQVFQQVEGMPLYRYHLRLRLARALDLLPRHDDLATLALDLGFSSHSHFTAAFKQTYGHSPSEFKRKLQSRN
jgi:AraC-like DNA-binding protein